MLNSINNAALVTIDRLRRKVGVPDLGEFIGYLASKNIPPYFNAKSHGYRFMCSDRVNNDYGVRIVSVFMLNGQYYRSEFGYNESGGFNYGRCIETLRRVEPRKLQVNDYDLVR